MGNGMEETHSSRRREFIATVAVLVVIVLIVVGVTMANKKSDNSTVTDTSTQDTNTNTPTQVTTSNDAAPANGSVAYKDGSYSATGSYSSPGGRESIDINLTLQNGAITAVFAKTNPAERESEEYQNMFLSAYKDLVIGKKISDIRLDRVSGSSLTSQGFNSAIEQIRTKAQS